MKRIAYTLLCLSTLLTGCQTADLFTSKLGPSNPVEDSDSQAQVEEKSKQFLAELKEKSSSQREEVELYIQRGQQEIVSWYQDRDDRHIAAAKKNFRSALKLQPKGNVDSLHGLAVVADLEENFRVAEQHYQLALAQSPGDSNILGNLGYSYLLQNRLQESERYLSRATQIDPGNVDAVKHLGEAYAKLGLPGKAQDVLAQVMSPEEARQFVGKHSQLASNDRDSSLMGKIFSDKTASHQNASISGQMNGSQSDFQSRESMMQFHNSASGYQYPTNAETQLSEYQLKERLAAIDQERNHNLSGGPVMIHSERDRMNSRALTAGHQPQMLVNSPSQIRNQSFPDSRTQSIDYQGNSQPNHYSEMSPYQKQRFAQNRQAQFQSSQENSQQTGFAEKSHMAARNQSHTDSVQRMSTQNQQSYQESGIRSRRQAPPRTPTDPLRKPWGSLNGNRATQVHFEQQETMAPYPGPKTLDTSRIEGSPIDHSQNSREIRMNQNQYASPQPGHHESTHIQQANASNTQYGINTDSASMQAAKLGMGVGPGNMFPAVNETAPQQQPGMQSTWNGNSFGQPNRMLPTDVPPLDLTRVNSLGQQLPGSTVNNQIDQFGTASRFDAQSQQLSNQYRQAQQNLHRQQLQMDEQLRDQRIRAQSQLHQQTQDVWNQRPLTPHTPSPGTQQLHSSAEYGGMLSTHNQAQNESVPPYAYSHRAQMNAAQHNHTDENQNERSRQRNVNQNYYYDANSYQNVIEPPPYRTGMNSTNQFNGSNGDIQQVGHTEPVRTRNHSQLQSNYGNSTGPNMPVIVPGGP